MLGAAQRRRVWGEDGADGWHEVGDGLISSVLIRGTSLRSQCNCTGAGDSGSDWLGQRGYNAVALHFGVSYVATPILTISILRVRATLGLTIVVSVYLGTPAIVAAVIPYVQKGTSHVVQGRKSAPVAFIVTVVVFGDVVIR
ncbi:hypothetical protein Tco_1522381 [Tanacetum coccineum]